MRRALAISAAMAVLFGATAAQAMGAIAVSSDGAVHIKEARVAYADAANHGTLWTELRLTGRAATVAWIVPVRDGTSVDQASSAFFDALEDGTAPRIAVPTTNSSGCAAPLYAEVATLGDAEPEEHPTDIAQAESAADVRATLTTWGLADPSGPNLDAAEAAGFRFVLLRFSPSKDAFSTVTLRLHGPAVAALPLGLSNGNVSPLRLTAWLVGDSRMAVQGVPAHAPPTPTWISDAATDYATQRDALLASAPEAWLPEVAGSAPLITTTLVGNGTTAPSVTDAYLRRVAERGEMTLSLGPTSDSVHAALAMGADMVEPCGSGTVATVGSYSCTAPQTDALLLGGADDLAFLFAGDGPRFVTRYAGRLGPQTEGKNRAIAAQGVAVLPIVLTGKPEAGCGNGAGGSSGGVTIPTQPSHGSGSTGVGNGQTASTSDGNEGNSGGVDVNVGVTYDNGSSYPVDAGDTSSSSSDSCSHHDGDDDASSCSKSDDSGSSDSCSKGDDSGSSDSCSGSSGSSDSCSGSSGGDSCSGSGSSDCSVGQRGKRHVRLSPILVGLAAIGLGARRRRRVVRS